MEFPPSLPLPASPACKYLSLLRSHLPLPLLREASPEPSGTLRCSLCRALAARGESPQHHACTFLHVYYTSLKGKPTDKNRQYFHGTMDWLFPHLHLQRAVSNPNAGSGAVSPLCLESAQGWHSVCAQHS